MQNISFEIICPREWSYIVGAINAIVWIIIFVYFRIKRSQCKHPTAILPL